MKKLFEDSWNLYFIHFSLIARNFTIFVSLQIVLYAFPHFSSVIDSIKRFYIWFWIWITPLAHSLNRGSGAPPPPTQETTAQKIGLSGSSLTLSSPHTFYIFTFLCTYTFSNIHEKTIWRFMKPLFLRDISRNYCQDNEIHSPTEKKWNIKPRY